MTSYKPTTPTTPLQFVMLASNCIPIAVTHSNSQFNSTLECTHKSKRSTTSSLTSSWFVFDFDFPVFGSSIPYGRDDIEDLSRKSRLVPLTNTLLLQEPNKSMNLSCRCTDEPVKKQSLLVWTYNALGNTVSDSKCAAYFVLQLCSLLTMHIYPVLFPASTKAVILIAKSFFAVLVPPFISPRSQSTKNDCFYTARIQS